jgi:hypothetical protein
MMQHRNFPQLPRSTVAVKKDQSYENEMNLNVHPHQSQGKQI